MTYRELHTVLREKCPTPVGYATLKAEIIAATGFRNPLKVAHTVRELFQVGAVAPVEDGNAATLWRVA